jgi:hypothetical protein
LFPARGDLILQIAQDVSLLLDALDQDGLRGRRRCSDLQIGIRRDDGRVRPEFLFVECALEISGAEIHMRREGHGLRRRQVRGQEAQREGRIPLLVVQHRCNGL